MNDPRVAPPLPEGRRAVLYALRRRGEASVEDIAHHLNMTVSGARQHVAALVDDGLAEPVDLPRVPGRRGRPQRAYTITDRAETLFPKAYGELTNELLGYLAETDTGAVDELFARRREQRVSNASVRLARQTSLRSKVAELTRILDEDGYLASWETIPGGYRIVEHNCAILAVAQRYGQACSSELEFIRTVLPEAQVDRVSHIIEGAHHCGYEVKKRRDAARRDKHQSQAQAKWPAA